MKKLSGCGGVERLLCRTKKVNNQNRVHLSLGSFFVTACLRRLLRANYFNEILA
jgi:hypothetical protein